MRKFALAFALAFALPAPAFAPIQITCTDTTADGTAIQTAINGVTAGAITLSAGRCAYNTDIVLKHAIYLRGEGEDATMLRRLSGARIILGGQSSIQTQMGISDLSIINDDPTDTATVILIDRAQGVRLTNLHIGWEDFDPNHAIAGTAIEFGTAADPELATNIRMNLVRIGLTQGYPGKGVYIRGGGGVWAVDTDVQGQNGSAQHAFWIDPPAGANFDTFVGRGAGSGNVDYGLTLAGYGNIYNIQITAGGFDAASGSPVHIEPKGGGSVRQAWFYGVYMTGGFPAGLRMISVAGTLIADFDFNGGLVAGTQGHGVALEGDGLFKHLKFEGVQIFDGGLLNCSLSTPIYRAFTTAGVPSASIVDVLGPDTQVWNDICPWAP